MSDNDGVVRFSAGVVREQILGILRAWGMRLDLAETTADVMVDTDLSGIDSHGILMLTMYETLRNDGRLDLDVTPEISHHGKAFAVIDARHGLGHPAGVLAMESAITKARSAGVGIAVVARSNHFGALGYYARIASTQGMFALVTTSTRTPVVAALGGTTPVLGTNPIAFSAPRLSSEPLVVDLSTSVVAMNKVKAYAVAGKELPDGWVVDLVGRPISDASTAHTLLSNGGATLIPLGGLTIESGGHKGFGLSLMVQVLSAAIVGAALPGVRGHYDDLGHFFMAIDPSVVVPGEPVSRNVDRILEAVQHDEPGVRIPGDPEEETRAERGARGIPLPARLVGQIRRICASCGAPFLLTAGVAT